MPLEPPPKAPDPNAAIPPWRIWVDTGGTFTDCIGVAPDGERRRLKVLSSSALRSRVTERWREGAAEWVRLERSGGRIDDLLAGGRLRRLGAAAETPGALIVASRVGGALELDPAAQELPDAGATVEITWPEPAPILGVRWLTGTPMGAELPAIELRLATTRGTNALLERRGVECALFITRGFADLLLIGNQARPDIFALDVVKPEPLQAATVEVDERLAADGAVVRQLELTGLREEAARLVEAGVRSAAVALLHSYLDPEHERQVGEALEQQGFVHVSLSSSLAPLIKIVPRAQTAVVDAYLGPIIDEYLGRIAAAVGGAGRTYVMTSAGGLSSAQDYRAKDSLLSGPAGGVVGAAAAGRAAGFETLLTFDMGGTSTDVARFDGDYAYRFEHRVGDAEIVAPTLYVETVAAGGGSICELTEGRLTVGPHSAGADPGPACYGAAGPLCVTDVNLLLGRIEPARFEIPIDATAASHAADRVLAGLSGARDELLSGFLLIANERMADAIRRVSIQEGFDPARCALVAFGGAGPQHACAIAELLGTPTVLVPRDASLLSALGLGAARIERFAHRQVLEPLREAVASGTLSAIVDELAAEAARALAGEGGRGDVGARRSIARCRYSGQESTLDLDVDDPATLASEFESQYQRVFGDRPAGREVELESLRVVVAHSEPEAAASVAAIDGTSPASAAAGEREIWFDGKRLVTPVVPREAIGEEPVAGPALVTERHSVTVVEPGWSVAAHAPSGCLVVSR
ncbi:MAG TPA: hydantoinase/oxoprolinase family protein [Thermoanaerobaculia bacterium]|nr:hydantoinase/oxoprolinase family protein [Thermoanaerobaculia bacterium]